MRESVIPINPWTAGGLSQMWEIHWHPQAMQGELPFILKSRYSDGQS